MGWVILYFMLGIATIPATFWCDYIEKGKTQWNLKETMINAVIAFFLWWLVWIMIPCSVIEAKKYHVVLDLTQWLGKKDE